MKKLLLVAAIAALSSTLLVTASEVSAQTTSTTPAKPKAQKTRLSESKEAKPKIYPVETDQSRDSLLTDFGKDTLQDRYLLPGETYQDLFVRVASAYADDAAHAQRLYDYISKLWFMPAETSC